MKLVPIDVIPAIRGDKNHKLQQLIEEFANSDMEMCEIIYDENEYKNPQSVRSSFGCALKRSGYPIKACVRGKRAFMFKI